MTDAEIAGIMGWRGPGCYTKAQMRKVRQCIELAVAPYREDAERYRWLRDGDSWPAVFVSCDAPEPIRGADLDASIDAARKGGA